MAKGIAKKGGKKNRKFGRAARKPKTARYKVGQHREKNKVKRVLQSSGVKAAKQYAAENGVVAYLNTLLKED